MQSNWNDAERAAHGVNAVDKENKSPLHYAADNGHEDVVRSLLAENADINLQDKNNDTALSLAVQRGHRNVAKTLLRHTNKPYVKYADKRDLTLLAAQKGKTFVKLC